MDGQQAMRDGNGRFAPGCSGNPAGKRKGTRNRATLLAEALRDGEDESVARIIIDKALSGDAVAARFCVGLLSPKPRGRAITLDLPDGARPGDVVAAFNVTLAAMAAGEITPDEALVVTRVLDGRLRALKAWQLEDRLTAYDRIIPGDEVMFDEEDEEEDVPPPSPSTGACDEGGFPDDRESAPDAITSPRPEPALAEAVRPGDAAAKFHGLAEPSSYPSPRLRDEPVHADAAPHAGRAPAFSLHLAALPRVAQLTIAGRQPRGSAAIFA